MAQKQIVHLRVYRGEDINYTSDGKIKNENQLVKITHNSVEWANFLRHLKSNRYGAVEVEKVLDGKDHEEVRDVSDIKKEVALAFSGAEKKVLTPEQQYIAELESKLKAIKEVKKDGREEELEAATEEYKKVFDKKPYHSWTLEQINEKIAEAKK